MATVKYIWTKKAEKVYVAYGVDGDWNNESFQHHMIETIWRMVHI